uniref:UBX domain-containing protein n=1 Tax=Syphacia muris TaxID=451379 RepID=A0A0N5AHV1_9BILA
MSMLDQLIEMGYPCELAKKSLEETSERSLEDALDWLENRRQNSESCKTAVTEKPEPGSVITTTSENKTGDDAISAGEPSGAAGDQTYVKNQTDKGESSTVDDSVKPKEITFKCNQCGKILKGELEVTFHAGETQHDVFSETTERITPLTEKEKELKVQEMREKIKVIMAKKEQKEFQEAIEKEKKRRLDGQATAEMLERRREMEMKQLIEQRKREKLEETEAKRRVLEQIKRDREAKKTVVEQRQTSETSKPKSFSLGNTSDSPYCCLQIRLPDGTTMKERFKSTETLAAVRLWVELNRKDPETYHYPFQLMVPFPRQVFTSDDMEKPLKALGLVPSACLVVTRAQNS